MEILTSILTKKPSSFASLSYMLFKTWNMYMDVIMNITVNKSAYIWVYLLNAKLWVRPKAKLEMHMSNLLIFGCGWLCLISISSEKFELHKYKMYLDVEIVALFMLLHNSKFNNFSEYSVSCHFLILSWFYNYNFIYIRWLVDISPLSPYCSNDY